MEVVCSIGKLVILYHASQHHTHGGKLLRTCTATPFCLMEGQHCHSPERNISLSFHWYPRRNVTNISEFEKHARLLSFIIFEHSNALFLLWHELKFSSVIHYLTFVAAHEQQYALPHFCELASSKFSRQQSKQMITREV